jgi:hypothetical protein
MSEPDNKPQKKEEEKTQLTRVDLMHHLLNNGTVAYVAEQIKPDALIESLKNFLQDKLKLEADYSKGENIHIIEYKNKGGITDSLGLSASYRLFFLFDQQKIYFDIKNEKWFDSGDNKFSLSKLLSDSYQADIQEYIFDFLLSEAPGANTSFKVDERNHFIESISKQRKIWFLNHTEENEKLLVYLALSSIKTNDGSLKEDKDLSWSLFITTEKTCILAFDKHEVENQCVIYSGEAVSVKKEMGRNPVIYKDISFLSKRSNGELFYLAQHISLLPAEEKIREIARLNWVYKQKNEGSNRLAIELINHLINEEHNPFDELALLYMEYSEGEREKVFSEYTEDNKLLNLLQKILNYAGTNEFLTKWIKEWEISYIDSVAMNNLLLKAVDDAVQANNILPFHRLVRDNFHKKNSDDINQVLFDITFSRHLIKCGLGNEAKKLLKKRLGQLPDETISDLLPAKDIDLTGTAAGQIIKVTILELLAELETEKNAIEHKCQVARLQPLVEERVDKLIEVSEENVAAKGGELKKVMQPEGLIGGDNDLHAFKYKVLDAKVVDRYVCHPAGRKGGRFSNFQKWLASVKIPDYSMLKSYSEQLSPQKYKVLTDIIADIKYALNIEKLEVYVSRGEKSVGINGFESNPLFLIVGGEHLEKDSPHYLNPLELRFAIGVELAHLYFKHSRITSTDMWKGALEKGYFVLDTVLSVIPAVGLFSKSIQGIGKLNNVSSFLQRTSKLGKVSSQSKEILNTSEQIVNIYKSKVSKDKKEIDKEKEFLATSRIIQLTADRCAFVFTKDLNAAIRAMFLVSKNYYSEIPVIEKYGLREFLLKKNDDGSYKHQELAIRLASLFSFYLSDDYEAVISKLEE